RVRGAEMDQDKHLVDQVSVPRTRQRDPVATDLMISQLLQTQQQLQTQMLQLISQQNQTQQQQLQAVLNHLQPGYAVQHPFAISTGTNFRDSSCFVCKEQGHFARNCPRQRETDARRQSGESHVQGSVLLMSTSEN
ncbi:hypothetical protein LSAT2_007664, partial [Lamellibrachia satsuma]